MKKINTISLTLGNSSNILTISQMLQIKGGVSANSSNNPDSSAPASVGPLSATADDKRRDRPGGGVSTH